MSELSVAYAKALYGIAIEKNQVDKYLREIEILEEVLDDELMKFFNTPKIDAETKKDVFVSNLKGFDIYLLNFISVIIDGKKQRYFKEIFEEFKFKAFEYLNIVLVKVYSAKPLKKVDSEKIVKGLKEKDGNKSYRIVNIIDENLIAGYKLMIDQQVIDTSLKRRISLLKEELMKEGD